MARRVCKYKREWLAVNLACCVAVLLFLSSCFTGIEGTKTITMSKSEKKQTMPSAEESLLSGLRLQAFSDSVVNRLFYVLDDRASVILRPTNAGYADLHAGDSLYYVGTRSYSDMTGHLKHSYIFKAPADKGEYEYLPPSSTRMRAPYTNEIPTLLDGSILEYADSLLKGRKVWILTPVWSDKKGEKIKGRRYSPATIMAVLPGTMVFPARVQLVIEGNNLDADIAGMNAEGRSVTGEAPEKSAAEGGEIYVFMNLANTGTESRSFANLFSLSDPRKQHPGITDKVWEAICTGNVFAGMTKEECRLALGNPKDINTGHNYSSALLLWIYENGDVLYFEDDILVNANRR